VTGTREATLKENGTTVYFATKEEAEAEAKRLMERMNHPARRADFQYWADEA
jgi:hypothetical protein